MRRDVHAAFLAMLAAGCGASRPRAVASASDCGRPIQGSPAALTLGSSEDAGPTFEAPRECTASTQPGFYIRVTSTGPRTLDYARSERTDCDTPDASPEQCPSVSVHVFGMAVLEELQKELGETNADGMGLGVCADHRAPLTEWNLSCQIHDWQYANRAIEVTHATLRRWHIGGEWGLSVTAIPCVVAE